jgi:hypothetical protein
VERHAVPHDVGVGGTQACVTREFFSGVSAIDLKGLHFAREGRQETKVMKSSSNERLIYVIGQLLPLQSERTEQESAHAMIEEKFRVGSPREFCSADRHARSWDCYAGDFVGEVRGLVRR